MQQPTQQSPLKSNKLAINPPQNEHINAEQHHCNTVNLHNQQMIPKNTDHPLSKKQLKKQIKKQKWQTIKIQKRKQQRCKQKQRRRQKRIAQNQQKPQQRLQKPQQKPQQAPQKQLYQPLRKRRDQYKQKMLNGLRVVIDLQFYDLMTQKQQNSLARQLTYCHSINRQMQKCFNYILTSVTQRRLEFMAQKYNIDNYGIDINVGNVLELFDRGSLVYLTGDAEEELEQFDHKQLSKDGREVYVIGGIVDHNRLKGLTLDYARENGIRVRRLPMGAIKLKASVHLAVNHVWEWMLRRYNGQTWQEAIETVIPSRKLQFQANSQTLQKMSCAIKQSESH